MRVVILWPGSNQPAFIVIVILIAKIPIEHAVDPDGQSTFRRLVIHWVRGHQDSGIARRIRQTRALPRVPVNPIGHVQRCSPGNLRHSVQIEETISHEVETMAQRVADAVKEVIHDRVAVDPVVRVACAEREL